MTSMRIHPQRAGLALLGSVLGTLLGVAAVVSIRGCSQFVAARAETGAPFDTLGSAERAAILRLRRLPPQADR